MHCRKDTHSDDNIAYHTTSGQPIQQNACVRHLFLVASSLCIPPPPAGVSPVAPPYARLPYGSCRVALGKRVPALLSCLLSPAPPLIPPLPPSSLSSPSLPPPPLPTLIHRAQTRWNACAKFEAAPDFCVGGDGIPTSIQPWLVLGRWA